MIMSGSQIFCLKKYVVGTSNLDLNASNDLFIKLLHFKITKKDLQISDPNDIGSNLSSFVEHLWI